ncbi:tRNA glutamyl-Q(34) synthetase GluQRS [Loktanella sp. D2R18]|uniref:tRNA glutamyl-Q(34) synthetase GluQRS n=1 Tax=Rhodobacterales TaxID=204455 RepID=UPI000DEAF17A|nr:MULTISPECIES: tRNA glutamyl-Q(34) synthetase GluQRS [Rhodobacterales]MDO6591576.1 tRNA glutamyl-Q(34) synthetase GluQRS [Yoonia sp. 1_MG-2023]RBW43695.1 tRNA glutamyl-Q(34) synthetase GluQRS [Loktanella sp. D2R18]
MITRFAPSPTGPLHLGHAYSALTVWAIAKKHDGTALLRIEDTDSTRARSAFEIGIYDDLDWLGLHWPTPVRRQSDHLAGYAAALESLNARGLLYPCSCSRREILASGATPGAEGLVYPGTCRQRSMATAKPGDAIRLNIAAGLDHIGQLRSFVECGAGKVVEHQVSTKFLLDQIGDPVLKRKDSGDIAYHLACVHDDALQNITHVVRGMDLWSLTPFQVFLQQLMGWKTPQYRHHALVTDADGKRLAKIDRSKALSKYRTEGISPDDIGAMIGLPISSR